MHYRCMTLTMTMNMKYCIKAQTKQHINLYNLEINNKHTY